MSAVGGKWIFQCYTPPGVAKQRVQSEMGDVVFGLFLLAMGLFMGWLTVMQVRKGEVTGETIFDLAGAVIPTIKRLMFWASTVFLGLLAAVALIGAVAFFLSAMGLA